MSLLIEFECDNHFDYRDDMRSIYIYWHLVGLVVSRCKGSPLSHRQDLTIHIDNQLVFI